ncbi:unnamed protein product [Soboliphyme baturini]|uniref:Vacuolar ATPase assembly protein VMA22 n=1 Tax=Soboliphyme baturini TaxID=241478 RepID=A0A183J1H0_9BILA|nr:unnamed protein product [Soboliphyme baturini]
MNDLIALKTGLESQLREGWICVAKSRIEMGGTSAISCLQFDERCSNSTVTVAVSEDEGQFVSSFENYTMPESSKRDILKRFGILTPGLLRKGQKYFISSINLVCEMATSQARLEKLCSEYQELLKQKKLLSS